MKLRRKVFETLVLLLVVTLTACGGGGTGNSVSNNGNASSGGGGASPPPAPPPPVAASPTAEGLYIGPTSNGRTVTGVILDNGTYWVLYSAPNNPTVIAGAVQGTSTSQVGSFSSSNARDFNLEGQGINNATVSASYIARQSLNGIVMYTNSLQPISFVASYNPTYDLTPSLALIAGTYSGTAAVLAGVENATTTITPAGQLSGRGTSGCQYAGTVITHARGNIYDVSVTFGGGVCSNGTSTVTGIGYYDATAKRLYGTALNADRSNGFIFVGTKP